jgi:multidrug resistance efflux pump
MQWLIIGVYVLIIWLVFAKLRLIRLSFPLALFLAAVGPIFILIVLIQMNFYHPGSSDARELRRLVQITPHITTPGRVTEINVRPQVRMKAGDVLFRIDPAPFEFEVKRLEAALAAAEQSVLQLKASLDQATAARARAEAQLKLAQENYDRQAELFEKKVGTQVALEQATRNLESARQTVREEEAAEQRARLAYESNIGNVNTSVAQAQQQLASAKYNLSETNVVAPCDGVAANFGLAVGDVVSASQSVMPFICDLEKENAGKVILTFDQGSFPAVHKGAYAEVIFPMYPGRVFTGRVFNTLDVSNSGYFTPSGVVPALPTDTPRFLAVVKLDDNTVRLPAGARGAGAVYTGKSVIAATFRMGTLRIETILNFMNWGT